MKPIGDRLAFVLPAYIFVFGIWSAASSYDYISGKWQTVASARRSGMRHLCTLLLPMTYMLVYIKFQSDADDAKEMSAGILALLFACVEFCRTVVGLWQLHVFRHWVVASMRSVESLGYAAKRRKKGRDGRTKGRRGEERILFEIADALTINDLIVDNRLSEGEIQWILSVRNGGPTTVWRQRMINWARWVSCIWYFPCLLVAICRSREPSFSSPSSPLYLKPYDAEGVWIRWACVLVAQVFPDWLEDMQKSGLSDVSSEDGLAETLARFRRGVLCSAAFHTQSNDEQPSPAGKTRVAGGPSGHSHLDFDMWHKYPELCKGHFSMQEFLRVACETGAGLPFGEPHTKARVGGKSLEYSYSKFKAKLHRIRSMFEEDDVERLEQMETSHLEWLAIFLSVPNWKPKSNCSEDLRHSGESIAVDPLKSTAMAMDNLRSQLGLAKTGSKSHLFSSNRLMEFPFFKRTLRLTLWGNRNVLETSLHVDNMLALSAGSQFGFMNKMKSLTTERISKALAALGISDMKYLYTASSSSDGSASKTCLNSSEMKPGRGRGAPPHHKYSSREAQRSLYQFLTEHPETALLEQRLTFLGCSMELLRTSLATWVQNNPNCPQSVWSPSVERGATKRLQLFEFQPSESFVRCLGWKDWCVSLEERHVETRLLWELQNHFHGLIPDEGLSPERHEAIILCLLSFPAINLTISENNGGKELEADNVANEVKIEIATQRQDVMALLSVPFAPQAVCVQARIEHILPRNIKITVGLAGDCNFEWEVWRNDFTNRLERCKKYQESNGLQSCTLIHTDESVRHDTVTARLIAFGTGQAVRVWPGWLPHRPSMCLFEVRSKGLILELRKEEIGLSFSDRWSTVQSTGLSKSKLVPIRYESANVADLEYVSTVVWKLLDEFSSLNGVHKGVVLHGASALADAMKQGLSEQQYRLKLSLAMYHENFDILENAVIHLCRTDRSSNVLKRAAAMIENFCSLVGKPKAFDMGAPGLSMKDRATMTKVLSLVQKLASETFPDSNMCKSFVRICTSFANCDTYENMEQATTLILRNIMSASHRFSEKEGRALSRDLGSILGRMGLEHNAISLLLYKRFSEHGEIAWCSNGYDALYGTGGPVSPTLATILLSIGANEENDAACFRYLGDMKYNGYQENGANAVRAKLFYDRAIANGAEVRAMNNLALLLEEGADGVDADPARAVHLYNRAINEGADALAMHNLAFLLQTGAYRVDADPVRAVELYSRAIAEGGHIGAMYNLALLLVEGAPGVDADPVKAMSLYERAIAEGADIGSMNSLAVLLAEGAIGVDANPARSFDLWNRAIDEVGDVHAMEWLASLVAVGGEGVEADPARAVDLNTQVLLHGDDSSRTEAMLELCVTALSVFTNNKHSG